MYTQKYPSAFIEEIEKISTIYPQKRMRVSGGKGFKHGIATVTRPNPTKVVSKRIIPGKLHKSLIRAEKKSPFGGKSNWGVRPGVLGRIVRSRRRRSRR